MAVVMISSHVNSLQKITTAYTDDDKTMQVFAKCDDFIIGLCQRLKVEIPPFVLHRRARISTQKVEGAGIKVTVTGLDTDEDLPYSFIKVHTRNVFNFALQLSNDYV